MSALPRGAGLLLAPGIRPAGVHDLVALAELLAPHINSGAVLPRKLDPADFLVADVAGKLAGCVALTGWTHEVIELGSLVSTRPGLGRRLVEGACTVAQARGHRAIVALTSVPAFFSRCGFAPQPVAPWAHARGLARGPAPVATKAATCALCPRLSACRQVLLARSLRVRVAA